MKLVFGIVVTLLALIFGGIYGIKSVVFDRECGGHLKRAADANTVELARKEMEIAVQYLEDNNMTQGYTSVLYNTPDEDVGFWYQNLKSSLTELESVQPEATQLERSNVLIKLRETLLDDTHITRPRGIEVFPHNANYFWCGVFVALLAFIGVGLFFHRVLND